MSAVQISTGRQASLAIPVPRGWDGNMHVPASELGLTALNLASSSGSRFLERMLCLATDHMGADGAVLMALRDERCDILCSVGMPLSANVEIDSAQFGKFFNSSATVLENARRHVSGAQWAFVRTAPYWQSLRPLKLDIRLPNVDVIAIFGSHNPAPPRTMRQPPPFFHKLIDVLHDLFSLITEIADLSNRPMLFGPAFDDSSIRPVVLSNSERCKETDQNVVERFLIDTLIQQPRILSRGNVSYHALRRWRATVKSEQISALKAIKRMPSHHFEETIAEEMRSWCRRAFGGVAFANIVAVPCGHSGTDCLARRIGQQVAKLLGTKYIDAFEPLEVKGSSHPKTNSKRPKMKLKTVPVGPLLLVDDVSSSGSHMEEATMLLRKNNLAVTSLAWIASS